MSARDQMFADIDRMDADAWSAYLAEDAYFRFGNSDPTYDRASARDALAGFYDLIDGVSHDIKEQWSQDDGTTIVESEVTYTRKDGNPVTVPIVTIYRTNEDDLIADYRVYADVAPVFAD